MDGEWLANGERRMANGDAILKAFPPIPPLIVCNLPLAEWRLSESNPFGWVTLEALVGPRGVTHRDGLLSASEWVALGLLFGVFAF